MTRIRTGAVSSLVLLATMATTAAAQSAPPASQSTTDDWTFTVAPYLVVAGMSGTLGVKGYDSTIDMSSSDLFSHLTAGFMGYVAAKKGAWGLGFDTIYAKLGTAATKGPVTIEPTSSTGLYTILGSRRISPVADLVFGARINAMTTTLTFTAPIQKEQSQSKTWVDPVVGVNLDVPLNMKVKFTMLADLGGFGAASKIAVDLAPAVQFRIAKHAWLAAGYRYIYDDYNDDEGFLYKVSLQGPLFGVGFPF